MAGLTTIPVLAAASVDTPGGTNAVLFIDSADGDKLKIKRDDGSVSVATVSGTNIVFPKV